MVALVISSSKWYPHFYPNAPLDTFAPQLRHRTPLVQLFYYWLFLNASRKYPCTYYGKDIMYKDIPFLNLGKASNQKAVPMEFCVLVEGQRYPKGRLDGNAGTILKNLSLVPPRVRERDMQRGTLRK